MAYRVCPQAPYVLRTLSSNLTKRVYTCTTLLVQPRAVVSADTTNFANSVMNDLKQAAERLRRAGQLKGMRACRRRPLKRGMWPWMVEVL